MLKLLILPFLLVLFWQGSVLSWAGAHGSETTKTKLQRLEFAGRERLYYLYFPESCRGKSKLPLVLVLHGAMENGKVIRKISGMDAEAERRGVLLAYPYGSGVLKKKLLMWNAFDCCGLAAKKDIDDVAFISALIDKLCADYPIDKTRIFACGYSNGAMFCFRLASELSGKIAAIGSIGGSMSGKEVSPSSPVSILMIHGDDDRHVPYMGGTGKWARWGYPVNSKPVSFAVDFWRQANECKSEPQVVELKNIKAEAYSGKDGSEVKLITLRGARHTWPGGKQSLLYTDKAFTGLNASRECLSFFSEHPKKE